MFLQYVRASLSILVSYKLNFVHIQFKKKYETKRLTKRLINCCQNAKFERSHELINHKLNIYNCNHT
ncbi:hypothetical protein BpHYR1_024075 [Brachionus plicatilis]|uniref:Uncharacterized protein n=1 Tax=Brachionus plicatilis TaxID=10195 RepID=A0A3M7P565_BRAPC|nr:hypothetical protein BpHYR1_024075 [Brachionus plicatilis]